LLHVTVPKGIVAGQQFIATIPFYKFKFRITVPSGVKSGQLLYITFKPTDKNKHTKKQSRRVCNQTEDYKKKRKFY